MDRMSALFVFRNTTAVKQDCIVASVMSYRNKISLDFSHVNHMYHMVTSCYHDNTNLTLVAKCQHPDTDILSSTDDLSENIPVTSQITGYTYWNKPCAVCNDDDDDLLEWAPNVLIKKTIPYFSNLSDTLFWTPYPDTHEILFTILNSRRFSDIIYTPPVGIMAENQICIREDLVHASDCGQTLKEEGLPTSDWLVESCRQFYSPVQQGINGVPFTNIFCLVCSNLMQLTANKLSCRSLGPPRASPGYLTALLNYKLEPDHPASDKDDQLIDRGKCNCAEMFDPYLVCCFRLCSTMKNPALHMQKTKKRRSAGLPRRLIGAFVVFSLFCCLDTGCNVG